MINILASEVGEEIVGEVAGNVTSAFLGLTMTMLVFFILLGIFIVLFLIGLILEIYLYVTYHKSNKRHNVAGLTGEQACRQALDSLGLTNVEVKQASFFRALFWGNSYSKKHKTVYLRRGIFKRTSITAVAVAAQKAGVAKQDADGSKVFNSRYWLAPFALCGPGLTPFIVLIGFLVDLFIGDFGMIGTIVCCVLSLVIIILSAVFAFVQIPIEKQGVKTGNEIIVENNLLNDEERTYANKYYKAYILDFSLSFIIRVFEIIHALIRMIYELAIRNK